MIFKVPCEVDEEEVIEKLKARVLRETERELRSEIKKYVQEEVRTVASTMDFKEIAEKTLKKAARSQMIECLERIRGDEYMKFRLDRGEVEPSAEKLYNLLTAYASYTKILDNKKFKEAVMDKASNEIADRFTKKFDDRERYDKIRTLIKKELDLEETS